MQGNHGSVEAGKRIMMASRACIYAFAIRAARPEKDLLGEESAREWQGCVDRVGDHCIRGARQGCITKIDVNRVEKIR